MPNDTFGFSELIHLTDIPRTRLIHWTQAGLITAGVREAQGTGHHRVFDRHDLFEVAVANALAQYGVSTATIGRVLGALRKATPRPWGGTPDQLLLLAGDPASPGAVWVGTRDELAAELKKPFLLNAPAGILINIGQIQQELTDRLGKNS